jgi:hypothetical protein
MHLYHNGNVSDVVSFSTHTDSIKGHQQRKWDGYGKEAEDSYKSTPIVGL